MIIASDKTKLSYFSGDKSAWPVYITIGNIAKEIRRKPSKRATLLLGYLPVAKLECWSPAQRKVIGQDLFHSCMKKLLQPLVEAGKHGCHMACADDQARDVFPLLASYVADHPERCVVSCTRQNRCPPCKVGANELGDLELDEQSLLVSVYRETDEALRVIQDAFNGDQDAISQASEEGLQVIAEPFWSDLPHCNIFLSFPPDILHQLHKGIFKDHIFTWCTQMLGEAEMDRRFMAMPKHSSLRHFKSGLSRVTQWTGNEHKEMEKVFIGAIAGGIDKLAVQAAQALMDFIYYSQFPTMDEDDLEKMDEMLIRFHNLKDIFKDAHIRDHFNIPKLHALVHYTYLIRLHGTPDGYNTETPERLHIDFAKVGYRASNKRNYLTQMTKHMERREAMAIRREYMEFMTPFPIEEDDNEEEADDFQSDFDGNQGTDLDNEGNTPIESDEESGSAEDPGSGFDADEVHTASPLLAEERQSVLTVSKQPAFQSVGITMLGRNFGAQDFLERVTEFVSHLPEASQFYRPTRHDKFPVFKKITIHLGNPLKPEEVLCDHVHARPSKAIHPLHLLPKYSAFDTVLVRQVSGM